MFLTRLSEGLGATDAFSSLPYSPRFLYTHLLLPITVALLLSWTLMSAGGDMWLADRLYAWQGHQWLWRDTWLTSDVLHKGGRNLSVLAWLLVLALTIWCWRASGRSERAAALRWPLLYLVLAVALSSGLVSLLKSVSNMDCPWSLQRYGGTLPFIGLFESRPAGMGRGVCFPGGHASAGYAWVCLYFVALWLQPAWRWLGLGTGLCLGLLFGLTQQFRGAHFLSHDLWTLFSCWLVALLLWMSLDGRRVLRSA